MFLIYHDISMRRCARTVVFSFGEKSLTQSKVSRFLYLHLIDFNFLCHCLHHPAVGNVNSSFQYHTRIIICYCHEWDIYGAFSIKLIISPIESIIFQIFFIIPIENEIGFFFRSLHHSCIIACGWAIFVQKKNKNKIKTEKKLCAINIAIKSVDVD